MPTKCYSLLLGARNTPARGKRFSRADDALIRAITLRHFPSGFTVLNADGGWYDPQRSRFVREESRQILVSTDRRSGLRAWAQELAVALRQDELLVIEVGAAFRFRRAEPVAARRRR